MKYYNAARLSKEDLVTAKKIGKLLEEDAEKDLLAQGMGFTDSVGGKILKFDKDFKHSNEADEESLDLNSFEEESDGETLRIKAKKKDSADLIDILEGDEENLEEVFDLTKGLDPKKRNLKELEKKNRNKVSLKSNDAGASNRLENIDDLSKLLKLSQILAPGGQMMGGMNNLSAESVANNFSPEQIEAIKKQTVANVMQAESTGGLPLVNNERGLGLSKFGILGALIGSKNVLSTLVDKARNNMRSLMAAISAQLASIIFPFICITVIFAIVLFGFHGIASGILSGYQSEISDELIHGHTFDEATIQDMILDRGFELNEAGERVSTLPVEQQELLRFAFSAVGCGYSQNWKKRHGPEYYDCSALAYETERAGGRTILDGCAADEAHDLYNTGRSLAENTTDLEIGDLIFYGGHENGRYLGIYHVAIYVGKGYVVEAYNSEKGVIYAPVRNKNVYMICRP